jgi:2-C-methyl-D-erythritol 2,4-cyclodiphosphate synthase
MRIADGQLIRDRGWEIGNIDSVIVAERPKLKPHIEMMRSRLAGVLNLELDQVGVKATMNEKLDDVWIYRNLLCQQ